MTVAPQQFVSHLNRDIHVAEIGESSIEEFVDVAMEGWFLP